jgi:hypothetical protein
MPATANSQTLPAIAFKKMRPLLILILTTWTIWSCGTKSTDDKSRNDFQVLLSNLKTLDVGYTYDLGKQDAEGCYTPDKNSDSLFYNPPFPILGQFNNGTIYSLIHFEPGDDMWPIIRTFDKSGKLIDSGALVFGNCAGWDCDFDECEEKFKIVNSNTIESIMAIITTPCDSLGNKDSKLTTKEIWKKTTTIDENGNLTTKEEKSAGSLSETFDEFFKRFTEDSLFQVERVKFPFRVIWRTEDGETTHETEKENWTHSTFYYDKSYSARQVDAYTQEIKKYGDSVKIEIRGVDNGIYVDYKFVKDNGKWILFSGKDYSN